MFTVEMEWDETAITVLDPTAEYEDFQCIMYDDVVYLRQWDHDLDRHHYIVMSPQMMHMFLTSFKLPEGAYILGDKE